MVEKDGQSAQTLTAVVILSTTNSLLLRSSHPSSHSFLFSSPLLFPHLILLSLCWRSQPIEVWRMTKGSRPKGKEAEKRTNLNWHWHAPSGPETTPNQWESRSTKTNDWRNGYYGSNLVLVQSGSVEIESNRTPFLASIDRLTENLLCPTLTQSTLTHPLYYHVTIQPFTLHHSYHLTHIPIMHRSVTMMNSLRRFRSISIQSRLPTIGTLTSNTNQLLRPTCYYNPCTSLFPSFVSSSSFHSTSSRRHAADSPALHGTTILSVRKGNSVVLIGDGQVSQGGTVFKPNARKVRVIGNGKVIVGFAGSTADCFALLEVFEKKLEEYSGQLLRAGVELAKMWRTDKFLRHLNVS